MTTIRIARTTIALALAVAGVCGIGTGIANAPGTNRIPLAANCQNMHLGIINDCVILDTTQIQKGK